MMDFFLILLLVVFIYVSARLGFFYYQNKYSKLVSDQLKYLLVKIPRKESDLDRSNDNTQSYKQNVEIMNQVLKNVDTLKNWWIREKLYWEKYVSLEMIVEKEIIKFYIWVPKDFLESFEKRISTFYPWAVIDIVSQPKFLEAWKFISWWEMIFKSESWKPIETYENSEVDPMDSILSTFWRYEWDEKVAFYILVSPIRDKIEIKLKKSIDNMKNWKQWNFIINLLWSLFSSPSDEKKWDKDENKWLSSDKKQQLDKKTSDALYEVKLRVLVSSPSPSRPENLLNDFKRSFSQFTLIGMNSFKFVWMKDINSFVETFLSRSFSDNKFKLSSFFQRNIPMVMNKKELTTLYHFPHSRYNKSPRLKWQWFKIVPAPDMLSKEGMLLWHNLYSWIKKEIRLAASDRFRHFYIVWQTGTWKSTFLLVQAKQDVSQWNWFCMIDPHWDLCEFILKCYPKERIEDLIYFDAWDFEMPIWFNALEAKNDEERDIVTNDLIEMFIQMYWPEIFGPRIQDYFRNVVLALMEQPDGWTLIEIMRMFTDEAYQKIKLQNVKNPVIRAWWEKTYKAMWDREKQEIIPYFQAKFSSFITTPILRNIIWQPKSSFDIWDAMQSWKIILLNLSKGKMWEYNSKLLWSIMVSQIKLAALRRAQLPEDKRTPYYLYIDEFQNFVTPSISTILSEARKYKLWLILAHQYIDQLSTKWLWWDVDLKWAIFGNVWSMMVYRVWAPDADFLEKEFSPDFSKTDLIHMDKFKWVMKISVNTQPSKPFSISVLNPYEDYINSDEKVRIIKEISRLKWWRKKELVEKEIYFRVWA